MITFEQRLILLWRQTMSYQGRTWRDPETHCRHHASENDYDVGVVIDPLIADILTHRQGTGPIDPIYHIIGHVFNKPQQLQFFVFMGYVGKKWCPTVAKHRISKFGTAIVQELEKHPESEQCINLLTWLNKESLNTMTHYVECYDPEQNVFNTTSTGTAVPEDLSTPIQKINTPEKVADE